MSMSSDPTPEKKAAADASAASKEGATESANAKDGGEDLEGDEDEANKKQQAQEKKEVKTVLGVPRLLITLLIASRVALMLFCVLCDLVIPDHEPDPTVRRFGTGYGPTVKQQKSKVPLILRFATRWDSAQFLGIAHEGYVKAQDVAFFPLWPL